MDILEICQNIIATDSSEYVGIGELCELYAKLAKDLSLESRVYGAEENPVLVVGSSGLNPKMLFHNHLDTKDPGAYSLWTKTNRNPFSASVVDQCMYGLGVADAKLNLYLQMLAMKSLKERSVHPKVAMIGVAEKKLKIERETVYLDEETFLKPESVIVSKPTNFYLENALCGRHIIRLTLSFSEKEIEQRARFSTEESTASQTKIFRGDSGHGLGTQLLNYQSAVLRLTDYLRKMPENVLILSLEAGRDLDTIPSEALLELNFSDWVENSITKKFIQTIEALERIQQSYSDSYEESKLGLPQINVTKIVTKPEGVDLYLCLYFDGQYRYSEFETELTKELPESQVSCRLVKTLAEQKFHMSEELVSNMKVATQLSEREFRTRTSLFESDARRYHLAHFSCVKFGHGKGIGNISEPNEFVRLEDIHGAIQFYSHLMEQAK